MNTSVRGLGDQATSVAAPIQVVTENQSPLGIVYTALGRDNVAPERSDAHGLLDITQGHWGIENRLHWVRDVNFGEDQCRVRCGSAPQVMAPLRNLAIGLLRLAGYHCIAAALHHFAMHSSEAVELVTQPLSAPVEARMK